jgi:hypothetical protein
MTGIPWDLAEHRLNTYRGMPPIAQKKRSMGPERRAAIVSDVKKLVAAGILRETKYQTWIANPVMINKT